MSKLSGTWYNELGSTMTLTADGTGGLTGQYNSAVGNAEDFYVLTGRYDADPPSSSSSGVEPEGTSIGWVVTYRNAKLNAHSTASWSGQYFAGDSDGSEGGSGETILTHWLLTTSSTTADVWSSTNIGTDTFTRAAPDAADVAKAVEKGKLTFASPHPEQIVAALNKAK